MTKTPDEIKKGLECCINLTGLMCLYCPYAEDGDMGEMCREDMSADALALIQQLQAENAEQAEKIKKLEKNLSFAWELGDGLKADNVKLEQEIDALKHRTKQLEAERDAAVACLKSNCTCPECKYFSDDIQDPCRGCKPTASKFEWRGVQKEE